jgi:hypothetical protein
VKDVAIYARARRQVELRRRTPFQRKRQSNLNRISPTREPSPYTSTGYRLGPGKGRHIDHCAPVARQQQPIVRRQNRPEVDRIHDPFRTGHSVSLERRPTAGAPAKLSQLSVRSLAPEQNDQIGDRRELHRVGRTRLAAGESHRQLMTLGLLIPIEGDQPVLTPSR